MKQNILQISVTAAPEEQTDTRSAGKMYEHNATALVFTLEESLVLPEYRYYAEFVTVSGTARTAYLTPDAQNQITVELPVEVTAQMTALCVFNIVQIAENGKTEQVIKAKTVRLYFSALENTDRLIDENHTFSVNQLLEAIRQNTFKGEKGDKGDAYILTDADRNEIAAKMNEDFYGLPLYKTVRGTARFALPGIAEGSLADRVEISPKNAGEPLSDAFVCIGKNMLEPILDSSRYTVFEKNGAYARVYFYLQPNTTYIFAKQSSSISKKCTSFIRAGGKQYYFCHASQSNLNASQLEFATDDSGLVVLESTGVAISQANYQSILNGDWAGIFIGEKASSVILRCQFETPLCAADAVYADGFDFISGKSVRCTNRVFVSASMVDTSTALQLTDGKHTVYRYTVQLPTDAYKQVGTSGWCNAYSVTETPLMTNTDYTAFVQQSGQTECVCFATANNTAYIYSALEPVPFCEMLDGALTADMPVTLIYVRALSVTQTECTETAPFALPQNPECQIAQVTPDEAQAAISYAAGVSGVVSDLEARVTAIENKL